MSEIERRRWYLHIADQTLGPYTRDQIRLMAAKNQIVENDLVYREGGSEWVPAKDDPILRSIFSKSSEESLSKLKAAALMIGTPFQREKGVIPETEVTLKLPEAMTRAVAAYERGELREADRLARAVLGVKADHFDALHLIAVVSARHQRFDEALASFDRALMVRPNYAEALCNRGLTLHELKRFDEALASFDRALAVRPDYAEALNNRGVTLCELKRFDEALANYDRALAVRPDYAEALSNRGVTLHKLKRFDEALASYDRALAVKPDYAEALSNCGMTLRELKRFDEALASYDHALALRPDYAEVHCDKSLLQLLTGDLNSGWQEYEWRWKNKNLGLLKRDFAQPRWLGGNGIKGKTILLHSEQGFGDTIQFCRYVPLVSARGVRVLLEVQPQLQGLMASFTDVAQVISAKNKLPHFDLHCPLSSLPLAFGTRIESIPANVPYLTAPSESVRSWSNLRIGLAWSGRPEHNNDANRSIHLRSLLQLLDVKADFVSLQKDVRPDDAAVLKYRSDLVHFGEELKTFSDTAAVISKLDLVISVDTSVAHLAGALAKPVWILLPFVPDWRWLLDREDSPWYPTARLFRQTTPGDWSGVVSRVAVELEKLLRLRDARASA